MPATSELKLCVKCNKDVTHAKRMKDRQGKYWCIACGIEDSKKKHSSKVICSDCRSKCNPTDVHTVGGDILCAACLAARQRHGDLTATPGSDDAAEARARKLKLALALGTFIAGVTLIVLFSLEII